MIFSSASDTQTYLYAACRQAKDIGEKKQQRHRAESKESDESEREKREKSEEKEEGRKWFDEVIIPSYLIEG